MANWKNGLIGKNFDFYQKQLVYVACGFYAAQIKGLALTDQITILVKDIEQVRMLFSLS